MKIERFRVVTMTKEFFEIVQLMPEAINASSVTCGEKTIQGAHVEFEATTLLGAKTQIPRIISANKDKVVMFTMRTAECGVCTDASVVCPHMDKLMAINHSAVVHTPEART